MTNPRPPTTASPPKAQPLLPRATENDTPVASGSEVSRCETVALGGAALTIRAARLADDDSMEKPLMDCSTSSRVIGRTQGCPAQRAGKVSFRSLRNRL